MSLNSSGWPTGRRCPPPHLYSLCFPYFRIARLMGLVNQACKRPLRPKTASKRKKPKIKDLLYAPKPDSQRYSTGTHACHSPYAQLIARQHSQAAKKEDTNLQTINLPHKDSLAWLRDLLYQHTHSLNDRAPALFLDYKYTHLSVSRLRACELGNMWLTRTKYPAP